MAHKLQLALAAISLFVCVSSPVFGQTLPDGKGKAEFVHNCTACHRADMVTRVKKTPDDWRKSVDEMAARGTDGTKQDLDNVVLYLDTYFALGKPASANTKPGGDAPLSPSDIEHVKRIIEENGCLTCHRIEQQGAYTGPSLNGVGTQHSLDEVRAVIIHHRPTPGISDTDPASSYQGKITGEDLDHLARYLVSLPPLPETR